MADYRTKKSRFYTRDEWLCHNKEQFKMTQDRGVDAEKLIEQSDRVRERTKEVVLKQKLETEWKFKKRIDDIQFVKIELENVRKLIQDEIESMNALRERIEDEIKYVKTNAGSIIDKCIEFRKNRQEIDLIHDAVEIELEKEKKKVAEAEALLQKILEQAIETKRTLRASLYLLNRDVEGKLNCLMIEIGCLNLKETDFDLKANQKLEDLDNANITVEEWFRYSEEIITTSKKKILEAKLLQSNVKKILEEVIIDLREQFCIVNNAFQERILELKEAKARLETHYYEMSRQVNDMTQNIAELEKSIQEKQGFLNLAETRLNLRANRPGVELVLDDVRESLLNEVLEIRNSVFQLQYMLSEAQVSLRYLLKAQMKLEEEINVKTNSIKIDEVDCMTVRQGINYQAF